MDWENGPLQIHKIEHSLKTSHFFVSPKAENEGHLSSNRVILGHFGPDEVTLAIFVNELLLPLVFSKYQAF